MCVKKKTRLREETLSLRLTIAMVKKTLSKHINMNHHALNRDDGSYLPQEYLHLVGK